MKKVAIGEGRQQERDPGAENKGICERLLMQEPPSGLVPDKVEHGDDEGGGQVKVAHHVLEDRHEHHVGQGDVISHGNGVERLDHVVRREPVEVGLAQRGPLEGEREQEDARDAPNDVECVGDWEKHNSIFFIWQIRTLDVLARVVPKRDAIGLNSGEGEAKE